MKLNINELVQKTFQIAFKDIIIFTPFIIFNIGYSLVYQHYAKAVNFTKAMPLTAIQNKIWIAMLFLGTLSIMNILIKIMVINMTDKLAWTQKLNIQEIIQRSKTQIKQTAIGLGILALPIALIGITINLNLTQIQSQLLQISGHITKPAFSIGLSSMILMAILAIGIWALLIEFFVIIIIINNEKGLKSIFLSTKFIVNNLIDIIFYSALKMVFWFFFLTLMMICTILPHLSESIIQSAIQGIADTILCILGVIFYKNIKSAEQPQTINIKV